MNLLYDYLKCLHANRWCEGALTTLSIFYITLLTGYYPRNEAAFIAWTCIAAVSAALAGYTQLAIYTFRSYRRAKAQIHKHGRVSAYYYLDSSSYCARVGINLAMRECDIDSVTFRRLDGTRETIPLLPARI